MRGSEDKITLRIGIIGAKQVGKSALTVRYLTRRFIGEYHSDSDMVYHQSLGHGSVELEIVDPGSCDLSSLTSWDGILLVYSITDKSSFEFTAECLSTLFANPVIPPVVLIGNKSDLEHLRTVEKEKGGNLAGEFGITFLELSVAENSPEVYGSFAILTSALNKPKRRFSVSRLLLRIGKLTLTHRQHSESSSSSGSESNFDGSNSSSCRASPRMWNFQNISSNPTKKSTIDCS